VNSWAALDAELALWSHGDRARSADAGVGVGVGVGVGATLWWRDDDAIQMSEPLRTMLALAKVHAAPVALAVVPLPVHEDLPGELAPYDVTVIQHGVAHIDRAKRPAKKSEFPPGLKLDDALGEILDGWRRLYGLFGERTQPVFVPPWNRIDPLIADALATEFQAVSTFGEIRAGSKSAQINTHVDVIDWRGTRDFVGDEHALGQLVRHLRARRLRQVQQSTPTGILTHHLVHSIATTRFIERLVEFVASDARIDWVNVAQAAVGERPIDR
jgi:hypothetical protein